MIKMGSEELEALRMYETSHLQMVKKFKQYSDIDYISKCYENFISEPKSDDIFEPGRTYIVHYKNNNIGMIGTKEIDCNGIIELWYIIDKYYRGKGYGSKTLGLITQYLIEYVQGVSDVKLLIDKENDKSIKCALNNGYNNVGEMDNKLIYRYFN